MIGAVGSGKTVYWSMLLHEPVGYFSRRGAFLEIEGNCQGLYEWYEKLGQGSWPPKTIPMEINTAEIRMTRKSRMRLREYQFLLSDVAGEIFSEYGPGESSRLGFGSDLSECSGLALFFSAVDRFAIQRLDHHYLRFLELLADESRSKKIRTPTAIILTKCDLLGGPLTESEVATYLSVHYPKAWSGAQSLLTNYKLFGTSAVGPLGPDGNPRDLKPFGLWDPLLWLAASI
jgi:hypothetical protein